MRNSSKKAAKRSREAKPIRDEYRHMYPYCQRADCDRVGTDIHEIARGPARQQAISERACLLHLCREHHDELGDYSQWPIARQLALKKWADRPGYDRQRVNEIRGRDPEAISELEVNGWYAPYLDDEWESITAQW